MTWSARAGHLIGGLRGFRPLPAIRPTGPIVGGFLLALVAALMATPSGAVDVGATQVTFTWTAASGPVASYRVFIARNGAGFPSSATATVAAGSRAVTVSGAVGERLKVRVAGVSAAGSQGPYSPESVEVRFVTATDTGAPVVVGDLDGDGKTDLILQDVDSGALSARSITSSTLRTIVSPPSAQGATLVDVGDYDGDGVADLLWRTTAGNLRLCLNDGVSAGDCRTIGAVGPGYLVTPVGDVNGDGRRDLVFQALYAPALLCLGAPAALATCANLSVSLPSSYVLEAGNAAGDGRGDLLVWSLGTGEIETCDVAGMALSGCTTTLWLASGWAAYGTGDLDGDGRDDILLRGSSTTMFLCPRTAAGDLACVAYAGPTSAWTYLGSGDYDGDGRPDLVFRDFSSGDVTIRLLNGTAAKGSPIVIAVPTDQRLLVF